MARIASTSNRDFSTMHKFLVNGVVILIVASLANIFLQLPALMLTISVMAIAIFSALLLLCLARRPRLLLLDEPTTGLDPVARLAVLEALADVLRAESRSVLFSSRSEERRVGKEWVSKCRSR